MYEATQASLKTQLETDDFFEGLVVLDEYPKTQNSADAILNSLGVAVVVGKARQKSTGSRTVEVSFPIVVSENNKVNTSADGAQKAPEEVVGQIITKLNRYRPADYLTPIDAKTFEQLDPEYGLSGNGVMAITRTII